MHGVKRSLTRLCVCVSILVWHYHDEEVSGPDAAITLDVQGLSAVPQGTVRLTHYRVDKNHRNAFTAWKAMGSPQEPTARQYAELEKAGQLQTLHEPVLIAVVNGAVELKFDLPRTGVSRLTVDWPSD